jgi:hypothetical protein
MTVEISVVVDLRTVSCITTSAAYAGCYPSTAVENKDLMVYFILLDSPFGSVFASTTAANIS